LPTAIDQNSVEEHHFYDRVTDEKTAGRNAEPSEGLMSRTGCVVLKGQCRAMALVLSAYMFKTLRVHNKLIIMPDSKTI
jgi:hypothetical protein